MAATDENVLSFATPPAPPAAALNSSRGATRNFSENVLGRLGELLVGAIRDAASIEIKTYTSSAGEAGLATTGDPITQNTRLRAFTRAKFDGDTETSVPLKADGSVDEVLWEIHKSTVAQARADRSAAIASAISAVQKIAKAVR
ncbi:MAG: hypothetical protein U0326_42915 [Polyangiales bacterium]